MKHSETVRCERHAGAFVTSCMLAIGFSCGALRSQTDWQGIDQAPSNRSNHKMAYDSTRGVVVLFGGYEGFVSPSLRADTWEWDGKTWTQRHPATSPTARIDHAMCYDPVRKRTVIFGGWDGSGEVNDTWEWDGSNWIQLSPAMSPIARRRHALAYDLVNFRVLLFGGMRINNVTSVKTYYADTWHWDGTSWRQLSPATSPEMRAQHAMVCDTIRAKVVLFGGGGSNTFGDTWEWDGSTWTRVTTSGPAAGSLQAMAYDSARARTVMFGHIVATVPETWEWDGAIWSQRTPAVSPPASLSAAMAYDALRNEVILFGASQSNVGGMWRWNGTTWLPQSPMSRSSGALAYDSARKRVVLFGGSDGTGTGPLADTWEFDGSRWTQVLTATSPSARAARMAYDSLRQRMVLFGGSDAVKALNETWEYDGTSWFLRTPVTSPPARAGHAMAYDSARGRTVVFSGSNGLSDLWEWDGTNWQQRFPITGPGYRQDAAMVYDAHRGRCVLHGGMNSAAVLNETWEWDGTAWYRALPVTSPPARDMHAMAYDEDRRSTVVYGGYWADSTSRIVRGDTWEWDGTQWQQRFPATSPPARYGHGMAYDAARSRVVSYGGVVNTNADTWEYFAVHPAAFEPYGAGCAGGAGTPSLGRDGGSLPWLGETFMARLSNLGTNTANHPVLLLGDSKVTWGSFGLPLDLTIAGMPGCSLLTGALVTFTLPNNGGSATWSIPVPGTPSLAGSSLFAQFVVTSPGANAASLVVSNGCEMKLGAK